MKKSITRTAAALSLAVAATLWALRWRRWWRMVSGDTSMSEHDTPEVERARVIVEVVAGLLPGKDPDPGYTRRYAITSAEWQESSRQADLLAEVNGKALGYAGLLMLQPDRLNWVRVDWIWL